MARCTRCGSTTDRGLPGDEYVYCDGCADAFAAARDDGIWVRWLVNESSPQPPGYYVRAPDGGETFRPDLVEAFAFATETMEDVDCRGLFEDGTGARWLVGEYLEANPELAEAVAAERRSVVERLLRLLGLARS